MAKHVFVWRPPESDIAIFARAGRDAVERRLDGITLACATVHVTHVVPPRLSLVPFRRAPMALVSLSGSDAALAAARTALGELPGRLDGYVVDETVPVPTDAGARATLVTLFQKSPKIDHETFRRCWFGEHTPMTLEIHPVVGYTRNVVRDVLDLDRSGPRSGPETIVSAAVRRHSGRDPEAPRWDGIVTEDFAELRDVTTLRLFGRGPRALYHAIRVALHVPTFLDLGTIETYLTAPR